ncbi:MAG: hypothetical protein ACN6O3_05940 [Comamonas sp.]
MQTLTVTSHMRARIGGAFYPTGFSMVMYPTEDAAHGAADRLVDAGFSAADIFWVPPSVVLTEIAPTVTASEGLFPSMGSDGPTIREFARLARDGHFGLLVRTGEVEDRNRLSGAIRGTPYAIAQRYASLVIEDL